MPHSDELVTAESRQYLTKSAAALAVLAVDAAKHPTPESLELARTYAAVSSACSAAASLYRMGQA